MNWTRVTKIFLIVIAVSMTMYDFIPFFSTERGDTISEVIAQWSLHLFTLPFAFGMLCGHFFFFLREVYRPKPYILIPIGLASVALDVVTRVYDISILMHCQAIPAGALAVGLVVGVLFWPQTRSDKL